MNKAKRGQIQDAFMNKNIVKNWNKMLRNQYFIRNNQFVLDMF